MIIWINLVGTAVNAFLGWALIFGEWGAPAMGIAGAGWANFSFAKGGRFVEMGRMACSVFPSVNATAKPTPRLYLLSRSTNLPNDVTLWDSRVIVTDARFLP